jgi:hypothetical protein
VKTLLIKTDIEFIENLKSKKGNLTEDEKQKLFRIRKKTLKSIKDLTYIANNLPEKQLNQVFTDDTLEPLFISILHRPDADKKRICTIVMDLIGSVLGDAEFALRIVPREAKSWITDAQEAEDPTQIVKALFFAASCRQK